MAKPSKRLIAAMQAADEYFALKAVEAELAEKEKTLKNVMLASGLAFVEGKMTIEGSVARVTISECEGRDTVDLEALKKILTPALLRAVMKRGKDSLRFGCRARVADANVEVSLMPPAIGGMRKRAMNEL